MHDGDTRTMLFRRRFLSAGPMFAALSATAPRAAAAARVVDLATAHGIDPTGGSDSSAGFQAALTKLQELGGGELYVPPGQYVITEPLTYSGASLAIIGCGQTLSILCVRSPVVALSVSLLSTYNTLTVRDIGFSPLMTGGGGVALSVTGQNSPSGTQSCLIENVDFCVAQGGYTSFANSLILNAVQRVNVRNVNAHSNAGIIAGGSFASISNSTDVRFNNCSIDIADTGFLVAGYCEGLHIVDTILANVNYALTTGRTPYSGNGTTSPAINLLGLYISGCEFNCIMGSAVLSYLQTAWISDTHFSTGSYRQPALSILGSVGVAVSNCEFTGQFNPSSPQDWTGIEVASLNGWNSSQTVLDGCLFNNLGLGVLLLPGAYTTTAIGLRMIVQQTGSLAGNAVPVNGYTMRAARDLSGNTSNELQWMASQASAGAVTNRLVYSKPE